MNEAAIVPRHLNAIIDINDTNGLNLGTSLRIEIDRLEEFTIEQFIAALQATTTLRSLEIFFPCSQTPEIGHHRMILLCRCISRLRLQNEHHPLRKLILWGQGGYVGNELTDQFLHSAKQCGIVHVKLQEIDGLPVQFLVDFCRDNSSLKVLEICFMYLSGDRAGMSLSPNDRPQDSSVIPTLDELIVYSLYMIDSTAATEFKKFVASVNYSALGLGNVQASNELIAFVRTLETFDRTARFEE